MTKQLRKTALLATAATLALAIPVAARASEPAAQAPTAEKVAASVKPEAAPAAAVDATKVAVDPKTGELRAVTPTEDAELRAQMSAFWSQFSTVSHEVKHDRKNHRYSTVVAPTKMRMAIVTIGPDGKPIWDCAAPNTDTAQFAAELRAKAAATQAQQEEK